MKRTKLDYGILYAGSHYFALLPSALCVGNDDLLKITGADL